MKTTLPALAFALSLVSSATVASAQRCDAGADGGVDPTLAGVLRDTLPADQGLSVPLDTPVRVRYFVRAPSNPTMCLRVRGQSDCVPGGTAVVGDEVVFSPAATLTPLTDYVASFADAAGGTNRINFRTGRARAPTTVSFAGLRSVDVDRAVRDACDPDAADITIRFDLAARQGDGFSTSPWADVDIEYVVYSTRGPGVGNARERERFRPQVTGGANDRSQQRTFRLSGADAAGPVCFIVRAIDPLGRVDTNTQEKCVNPAEGNYFEGCAARPGRGSGGPLGALVALGFVALSRRRARTRG